MNRGIDQLLEVLVAIRDGAPPRQEAVTRLRKSAVVDVAAQRGIDRRTVANKYIRGLGIADTDAFDALVGQWLFQGSDRLQRIMESRSNTYYHPAIRDFFADADKAERFNLVREDDGWRVRRRTSFSLEEPATLFHELKDALDWISRHP